ncbi:Hypothetical predicted protein [Octopus vulgaris]|uniref:Centromere protein J n=1 Tax=Octopus vulgaris TaxID=6645 RepID=A0AA36C0N9_OCTVU|nr:Hypothetical predicted protein [Octopus vulgaris]
MSTDSAKRLSLWLDASRTSIPSNKCSIKSPGRSSTKRAAAAATSRTEEEKRKSRAPTAALQNIKGTHSNRHQAPRTPHNVNNHSNYSNEGRDKGCSDNDVYYDDVGDDRQTWMAAAGSHIVETNSFPQHTLGNGFATNYCDLQQSGVNGEPSYLPTRTTVAAAAAVTSHEADQLQLVHRFKELRRQQIQQQEMLMHQQKQQLMLLRQEMEQRQKVMANLHADGAAAGLIHHHVKAETPPRIHLHVPAVPSATSLHSKDDIISSSEDEYSPNIEEQRLDGFHVLPEDAGSDDDHEGHCNQMNSPDGGEANYIDPNDVPCRGEENPPLHWTSSHCNDEVRCLEDTPALTTTSDDLECLQPVSVNSSNLDDERPITSEIGRVKTFQQLLEEELQKEKPSPSSLPGNPKRNFLRRGEGIARFNPPPNEKSIQRHAQRKNNRSKSSSAPHRTLPLMLKDQNVPKRPASQPVLSRNKSKETKIEFGKTQCKPPICPPPTNRRRSKSAAAKPLSSSSSQSPSLPSSQKPQTTTVRMLATTPLTPSSHCSVGSSQKPLTITRSAAAMSGPLSHLLRIPAMTAPSSITEGGNGNGTGDINELVDIQSLVTTGAGIPANPKDVEKILRAIYEGQPLPGDSEQREEEETVGKGSALLNESITNSVEVETKDLAEFEFMEQLADDMSFCSDSSVVVKFMHKRLPYNASKLTAAHTGPTSLPDSWRERNSAPSHRPSVHSVNSVISAGRENTEVNGITDSGSDTEETLFSSSEHCSDGDLAYTGADSGEDGGCDGKIFWTGEEVTNDGYVSKKDYNSRDGDTQMNGVVEYQESDSEERGVSLGRPVDATTTGFGSTFRTGTIQNKIDTLFLDSSPKSQRDRERGQRSTQQVEVIRAVGGMGLGVSSVTATAASETGVTCRQRQHRTQASSKDSGSHTMGHSEVKVAVIPLTARGVTRKIAVKDGGSHRSVRGGYVEKRVGTEEVHEYSVGTDTARSMTFGGSGGSGESLGGSRGGGGVKGKGKDEESGSARSSDFCSSDECMTDEDGTVVVVREARSTNNSNGRNSAERRNDVRDSFAAAGVRGRVTGASNDSPSPSDESDRCHTDEDSGSENNNNSYKRNDDGDSDDDDDEDDDEDDEDGDEDSKSSNDDADTWNDTCDSVKKIEESLFQKTLSNKQDPANVVLQVEPAGGKLSSPSSSVSAPPTSNLISKLFPALQTKSQNSTKEDEKQSQQQMATQAPARDGSQSQLLREKLAQLEKEITRFQKENSSLEKLRVEREESVKKLREEVAKFDLVKKDELQKLEEFKEQELKKLRNEKKLFEKYKKAVRSLPSKQDRQEIETLRSQLKDLQEEMKRKESRWNANNNRLRQRIQELEDETHQLKDEIHFMERKRLEWMKEKEAMNQAKKKSIPPISHTPSLSLSTLNSSYDSQTEDEAILEHVEIVRNGTLPSSSKNDPHSGRRRQQPGLNQHQHHSQQQQLQQASEASSNKAPRSSSEALPRRPNVTSAAPQDLSVPSKMDFNRNHLEVEREEENKKKKKKNDNSNKNNTKKISLKHPGIVKGNVLEKMQHPDGKTEKVYQNGARELIFSNGTRKEMSADGKHIALHFFNGDIKQITADQTVIYFYAESETLVTTYPDGLEVLEFPTGQIEKHFPNGTQQITFPDQTVKYLHEDGSEESHCLDGTVIKVEANGIRTLHFPNGQREIHTDQFKDNTPAHENMQHWFQIGRSPS